MESRGAPGGTPGALSFPYFFGHAKKYGPVRVGQDGEVSLKLICYLRTFSSCLMQAAPTSFISKEVGKKGNKKRGLPGDPAKVAPSF